MEELEYYGFLTIVKQTKKQMKDTKNRKFKLKVDLRELCTEIDNHPYIANSQIKTKQVDDETPEERPQEPSYLDRDIKQNKIDPNAILKRLRMENKLKQEEAERQRKLRKLENPQEDDSSELSDLEKP